MSIPEEIDRLLAQQAQADLDQLGRAQTGGPMLDPRDLEAIKKHVYQLQLYDFRGGQGLNYLIGVEAPTLIAEIERLRARENRGNIERSYTSLQAGDAPRAE